MTQISVIDQKALNTHTIQQACELFGGKQTYAYILKDTPESDWRTARERDKGIEKKLPTEWSSFYKHWYYLLPLNETVVKSAYKNKKIIGRRPGAQDDRLGTDVDAPNANRPGSPYHPDVSMEGWASLITFIEENFGANFIVVRSSKSNGYHIYVFFNSFTSSDRIAHRAKELYESAGFEMGQGKLETFPNVRANDDAKFNGLRLPCITEDSYVVDPYTLERIGGIELFTELAQSKNDIRAFLGLGVIEPIKKVEKSLSVTKVEAIKPAEEVKPERKPFNLYKRMKWSDVNRSNSVIGAHVAYVIEHLGIIDPTECEQAVWESLHDYGYKRNASKEEQRDRSHVRRWIACRLKKGTHAPLAKITGAGDSRLNEIRSEDSKARFNYAIDAAKKAGEVFSSWNQMFKWVNRWLSQHYLATIGGSTWAKLKNAAAGLLNNNKTHTVDQEISSVTLDSTDDQGFTSPQNNPSKPAFKSVFTSSILELGQKFVSSVVELTGCDRNLVPALVEQVLQADSGG
jgi:hypothetical protein